VVDAEQERVQIRRQGWLLNEHCCTLKQMVTAGDGDGEGPVSQELMSSSSISDFKRGEITLARCLGFECE
jgi:hypothetical protein